jgi:CobQ-like glutamine amidotransferase family enzyme
MGGAQDRQQKLAGVDFLEKKGPVVKKMIENDTPALFVCAAYQFVGHFYHPYQGKDIKGAGIFDLYTVHPGDQAKRLIGNVVARVTGIRPFDFAQGDDFIVGFENHGGRTYLGKGLKPFAKVIRGCGNNGEDGFEGAVYRNSIGSYFHGPILPKNPHLADWLIKKALEVKYQKEIELEPRDDTLEWQAHKFMLKKIGVDK